MTADVSAILNKYRHDSRIGCFVSLDAAFDGRLETTDLVALGIEQEELERNGDDGDLWFCEILQNRSCTEVFERMMALLKSRQPAERQFSLRVLSEFMSICPRPTVFSYEIVSQVSKLMETETDGSVYEMALRCVAWQKTEDALEFILAHVEDSRSEVRLVVARNLMPYVGEGEVASPEIANALQILASDEDEEVRYSVFHDIAHFPSCFERVRTEFIKISMNAKDDEDEDVRKWAAEAQSKLALLHGST